jgi:predicted nucleic acid-binding protein
MSVTRYPVAALLTRIWRLRDNLTAFDAAYIALAEALDAPVLTTDAALARSSGHRARVELYPLTITRT